MSAYSDIQIGLCDIKAAKKALLYQLNGAGDLLASLLNERDSIFHAAGAKWDHTQYLIDDLQQELSDILEKIQALRVHIEI